MLCTTYIQQENDASSKHRKLQRKVSYVLDCYGKQKDMPGNAKRSIVGHGGAVDPPYVRMSELCWCKL
jgi:hypothetical protein